MYVPCYGAAPCGSALGLERRLRHEHVLGSIPPAALQLRPRMRRRTIPGQDGEPNYHVNLRRSALWYANRGFRMHQDTTSPYTGWGVGSKSRVLLRRDRPGRLVSSKAAI